MNELAAALEATALAQHLKVSRWTYPAVNAGHLLGIALLIGSVVPMDLRLLRLSRRGRLDDVVALLRPVAAAGALLAILCGALLFTAQAADYLANGWFQTKMALLALALLNAALHPGLAVLPPARQAFAAAASLALWPAILMSGRMIGYS